MVLATGLTILSPLGIILYQSFLDGPFFQGSTKLSLSAFRFVLADADFHRAFGSTLIVAVGMTGLAVPLGGLTPTDVVAAYEHRLVTPRAAPPA